MYPIMHSEKKPDNRGVEGVRRTTAKPSHASLVETASPQPAEIVPPDPEVVARPTRRRFTAADKLRILKLADACTAVGSLGGLLRAEGLYASNPHNLASPTHGGRAVGLDAPEARPKSLGSASAAGRECDPSPGERPVVDPATPGRAHHRGAKKVSQILGLPLETPAESERS